MSTLKNWMIRVSHYGIKNTISLMHNLRSDRCFKLKYCGREFYLRGNTVDFAVFNSIFAKGEYDFEIGFKPGYIIDAGAFTGLSAVYFHNKYPGAKIIAVEPEKSNFDLLVRNTQAYDDIFCVYGGVYSEDTTLSISDPDAEKYAFQIKQGSNSGESVPGYTIETLMKNFQLPQIDILKLDIEGAEYNIFKHDTGGWLPQVRVLVAELHEFIHPGVGELVLSVLEGSGRRIIWKGENLIAFRAISEDFNSTFHKS